MPDINGSY